jgi:hypothetical protein
MKHVLMATIMGLLTMISLGVSQIEDEVHYYNDSLNCMDDTVDGLIARLNQFKKAHKNPKFNIDIKFCNLKDDCNGLEQFKSEIDSLSFKQLAPNGAMGLENFLHHFNHLKKISIEAHKSMDEKGEIAIMNALKTQNSIESLSFRNFNTIAKEMDMIPQALSTMSNLKIFFFSEHASSMGVNAIMQGLTHKNKMDQLFLRSPIQDDNVEPLNAALSTMPLLSQLSLNGDLSDQSQLSFVDNLSDKIHMKRLSLEIPMGEMALKKLESIIPNFKNLEFLQLISNSHVKSSTRDQLIHIMKEKNIPFYFHKRISNS